MDSIVDDLPAGVFAVMTLFLLAIGGVMVFAGLHARRRAALMASTATSLIGMAEDGYREFVGTVEAIDDRALVAPLTQSRCCWYRARLERYVPRTTSRVGGWEVVRDVTSSAPFFVRDASGVCTVLVHGAEVTPTDRSVWTGATELPSERNPPRVRPSASARPVFETSATADSQFRYTEERIYPGDSLVVMGDFASRRFGARDASDADTPEVDADEGGEAVGAGHPDRYDDGDIADALAAAANETTRATIGRGASRRPFLFTTTQQDDHVAMAEIGSQAALHFALAPLMLAALLIWLRIK